MPRHCHMWVLLFEYQTFGTPKHKPLPKYAWTLYTYPAFLSRSRISPSLPALLWSTELYLARLADLAYRVIARYRRMCLARDYADVYPIEIRTRKATRRGLFNLGIESTRRMQAQYRGRYQRPSHCQPQAMDRPLYQIIEPRRQNGEGLGERNPPARYSIPRGQSFHARLPSLRRFADRAKDHEVRPSRRRDRSPRPFTVDPPEVITRVPLNRDSGPVGFENNGSEDESDGSCSGERQPMGDPRPPRERSPVSEREPMRRRPHRTPSLPVEIHQSSSPRHPRPSRPTRNSRPPRERTPVSERKPEYRRQRRTPSLPVEIHQSRSPTHVSDKNMKRRQVRFAEEDAYVQNTSQARRGSIARKLGGRRRTSLDHSNQETPRVRVGNRRDSFNSSPTLRVRSPPFGEIRGRETTFTSFPRTRRMPPRIIQEGKRQISEAGERIRAEARSRRSYAGLRHNLRSYATWNPRSRPSDRLRESRFDDLRTSFDDTNPYRFGRRGRWR